MMPAAGPAGRIAGSIGDWWSRRGVSTRRDQVSGRAERLERFAWALPLVVFFLVRHEPQSRLGLACAAIVVLGIVTLIQKRPAATLLFLVGFAPLQTVTLSFVYGSGAPAGIVRNLTYWKELAVGGLVIVALRHGSRERHRLDRIDAVALAFVVGTSLYLLLPQLFLRGFDAGDFHSRSVAWRNMALFVIAFVAVRHGPFDDTVKRRAATIILVVGGVMAAAGLWEFFASDSWNRFAVETLHVPAFRRDILGAKLAFPNDLRTYGYVGGTRILRVGSIQFTPLTVGFDMVLPLAIGIERIMRKSATLWVHAITVMCVFAILFTQTRSAIIAAAIVGLLAIRAVPGRSSASRARFGLLLAAGMVILVPVAIATGVSSRVLGGDTTSTQEHQARVLNGISDIEDHPLGRGLGTAPDASRFGTQDQIITENYYLQTADQVGVVNGALFVALTILLCRLARRAVPEGSRDVLPASVYTAAVGLAIGGLFLHVWDGSETSLVFWSAAGLVLAGSEVKRRADDLYSPLRPLSRSGERWNSAAI